MKRARRWGIALCLGLTAHQAQAVEDIDVPANATFLHERTQISFPPELGGLERTTVRDFGTDRFDVAAIYYSEDDATFLTFYVYRAGLPDASIWADRTVSVMTAREGFHPAAAATVAPVPFTPTGRDRATGVAVSYDLAPGQPYKATGVMLFPHGPWLIKLRATSSEMDAEQISDLLRRAEGSLRLPEPTYLSSPTYPVEACSSRLNFSEATLLAPEQAEVTALAVMMDSVGSSLDNSGRPVPLPRAVWCRDDSVADLAVYRPGITTDRYVIALGDGGSVIQVGVVAHYLPDGSSNAQSVPIIFADTMRSMLMAVADRLPEPAKALQIAEQARALGTNDREGRVQITANASAD